jgi:hypothetical protein
MGIERDLKLAIRQFFHNIKNIPPWFLFFGRVFGRYDVHSPDFLSKMIEALLVRIPPGNRRVPAPAFVIRPVTKSVLWQNGASGDLVVRPRFDDVNGVFPDRIKIFKFERRVFSQDFIIGKTVEVRSR